MKIELISKSERVIGAFEVADSLPLDHPIVIFNSRMYRHHAAGRYHEWIPPRLSSLIIKSFQRSNP